MSWLITWNVWHCWCWRGMTGILLKPNYIPSCIIDRYQPERGCLGCFTHLTVNKCCPHWDISSHGLASLVNLHLSQGLDSHLYCGFGCLGGNLSYLMGHCSSTDSVLLAHLSCRAVQDIGLFSTARLRGDPWASMITAVRVSWAGLLKSTTKRSCILISRCLCHCKSTC